MTEPADLFRRALDHHRSGRLAEASALYQEILQSTPDHTDVLYLLGVIAHQTAQPAQSIELMRRALAIAPDQGRCFHILALSLMALGMEDEAEASFRRAIALDDSATYYHNLGHLWKKQGRLDDAVAAYQQALARSPDDPEVHCDLGDTLQTLGRLPDAVGAYRRALELNPQLSRAWYSAGCAEASRKEYTSAAACFHRALEIHPDWPEAQHNLGQVLFKLGQVDEALNLFRQAATGGDPALPLAAIAVLIPGSPASDNQAILDARRTWAENHLPVRRTAEHPTRSGNTAGYSEPASYAETAGHGGTAGQGKTADYGETPVQGETAGRGKTTGQGETPGQGKTTVQDETGHVNPAARQLRIGYVSAFFQDHNWMKPVWGLINRHDRDLFEIHLFSDAPASRIEHGYLPHSQDHFHDTTGLSNEELAGRIEQAKIDLLVDLNGYSVMPRLPLFALRPAPVVIGWFNMYATTGISSYDYLIGDHQVIPPDEEKFYCETIARVPGSYLTFEVTYPVPAVADPPCLTKGTVTFGCLASQYKITDEVIGAWSRILRQAPNSTLLLKNGALASEGVRQFVHGQFERRQISQERVWLQGPSDHYQFLETYGQIDIALDTFPYNGGTTTTEAIWQGVPVITFWGDRWVARTSASILRAARLNEFVGQNLEDSVSLAIQLAKSPAHLADLRRNMRARLTDSPVCDTQTFARNMERLYTQMVAGAAITSEIQPRSEASTPHRR